MRGIHRSPVNSPVNGEFPAQRASDAENVSIWWHHHVVCKCVLLITLYIMGHQYNANGNLVCLYCPDYCQYFAENDHVIIRYGHLWHNSAYSYLNSQNIPCPYRKAMWCILCDSKCFPQYWPFVQGIPSHLWIPNTQGSVSNIELRCFFLSLNWLLNKSVTSDLRCPGTNVTSL